MEAIFTVKPIKGKIIYPEDLTKYLLERDGVDQIISIKDAAKTAEKMQMYAFLFGPVMSCAVDGFTAAGYEGVDKVKARYLLEAELCKAEVYNKKTGEIQMYTESIAGMSKKRLLKFINDVLFFLEIELGQRVPDSEEWKAKLSTGRNFKAVNKKL